MKLPVKRFLKSCQLFGRRIFGIILLSIFPIILLNGWDDDKHIFENIYICFDAWCETFWIDV